MLLFGEAVNTVNLYDVKKGGITENIPCSLDSYKQLIELCFDSHSTATFLHIFITSIIYYLANPNDQPEEIGSTSDLLNQLSANPNNVSSIIKLAKTPEAILQDGFKKWIQPSSISPTSQYIRWLQGFQGDLFQIITQMVYQKEQNQVTPSELETLTEFMRSSTSEDKQTLAAIGLAFTGKNNFTSGTRKVIAENLNSYIEEARKKLVLAAEALLRLKEIDGKEEAIREVIQQGVNSSNEENRAAALRALPLLGKFTQL